jgi:hypothetical protein
MDKALLEETHRAWQRFDWALAFLNMALLAEDTVQKALLEATMHSAHYLAKLKPMTKLLRLFFSHV